MTAAGSVRSRICYSHVPSAIAFSPHLDDAVFSCGGTLARLTRARWDVTVCSAFTRSVPNPSGFALACQLDKGLPADVDYMAMRRDEDAEACRRIGCRQVCLPFAEAPHRGYDSARALFGPVRDDDTVGEGLSNALLEALCHPPDLVLAPQAIGGHVDHVQLALALRRVLGPGIPVLWWTDFPYSMRPRTHPANPFAHVMADLPEHTIVGDASARLWSCAAYATQIGFQFGGPDGLARALADSGPVERVRIQGTLPEIMLLNEAAAP